jgi:uncharacterized glyoxalase superfamily protein PhnB
MSARLFAYRSYRDASAALEWLGALGFETTQRVDRADGGVEHSEVRLGDVALMIASFDADYIIPPLVGRSTGGALYLLVDQVGDLYEKAIAAGGTSVFSPEETEWGTLRARVLDPEGWEWNFGTYEPGQSS